MSGKKRTKKTSNKSPSQMNAHVLGSVYVTLHELISQLYNNDTITEREHDHFIDLLSGGREAIAKSKERSQ